MSDQQEQNDKQPSFFSKYLSKTEVSGWLLCISSMMLIVFAKNIFPPILPYAWIGAIVGAGIIGWGTGRKHKRK